MRPTDATPAQRRFTQDRRSRRLSSGEDAADEGGSSVGGSSALATESRATKARHTPTHADESAQSRLTGGRSTPVPRLDTPGHHLYSWLVDKRRFLISHPSAPTSGKHVLYIWARSRDEIAQLLPDAEVWEPAPEWLTDEMRARLSSLELDIDEPFDIHLLTHPPDLVFDRRDPPPGFEALRDNPGALQRGPDVLAQARELFRERS